MATTFFNEITGDYAIKSDGWGGSMDRNLEIISGVIQIGLSSDGGSGVAEVSSLPVSPANGDTVILSSDKKVYVRFGTSWKSFTPKKGWFAVCPSTGFAYYYDESSTSWVNYNSVVVSSVFSGTYASNAEVGAGTVTNKIVTPSNLHEMLVPTVGALDPSTAPLLNKPLYVNSVSGDLFIYDFATPAWKKILSSTNLINSFTPATGSSDPVIAPTDLSKPFYFNTTTGELLMYSNSQWVNLSGNGIKQLSSTQSLSAGSVLVLNNDCQDECIAVNSTTALNVVNTANIPTVGVKLFKKLTIVYSGSNGGVWFSPSISNSFKNNTAKLVSSIGDSITLFYNGSTWKQIEDNSSSYAITSNKGSVTLNSGAVTNITSWGSRYPTNPTANLDDFDLTTGIWTAPVAGTYEIVCGFRYNYSLIGNAANNYNFQIDLVNVATSTALWTQRDQRRFNAGDNCSISLDINKTFELTAGFQLRMRMVHTTGLATIIDAFQFSVRKVN